MNVAAKILLFIVMVFLLGGLYQVFNFAEESYNEAMANTSAIDDNPYPNFTSLFTYLWVAIPVVLIVALALYFMNLRERFGGYIQ